MVFIPGESLFNDGFHCFWTGLRSNVFGNITKTHKHILFEVRVRLAIWLACSTYSNDSRPLGQINERPDVAALTATQDEQTTANKAVKPSSLAWSRSQIANLQLWVLGRVSGLHGFTIRRQKQMFGNPGSEIITIIYIGSVFKQFWNVIARPMMEILPLQDYFWYRFWGVGFLLGVKLFT